MLLFLFFENSVSRSMSFYEIQDFREVIPALPVQTTLGAMGSDAKWIRVRLLCSAVN